MHCFSSRVTSWLTRTLRVGGCVLRRRIGASVIRPSHLGWPTQQQRRSQEAVAVLWSQPIPQDRHRQIERKVCTIVGGVTSPLLANVYLHDVFDLWAERWRRREARGDMMIVRYADDIVVGFEHEADARRFRDAMRARLEEFALTLHPDKTRLIAFGRFAADRRAQRGLGKPETFCLGFTHICGRSRRGPFQLQRKSRTDRMRATLRRVKDALRRRMHQPIPVQGRWLTQVVRGYFAYHAVPTNRRALMAFRHHVTDLWRRTLRRRSQKDRFTWARMATLADGSPDRTSFTPGRVNVSPSDTQGGSRVPELGPLGSVRGALSNGRPYPRFRSPFRRPCRPCGRPAS